MYQQLTLEGLEIDRAVPVELIHELRQMSEAGEVFRGLRLHLSVAVQECQIQRCARPQIDDGHTRGRPGALGEARAGADPCHAQRSPEQNHSSDGCVRADGDRTDGQRGLLAGFQQGEPAGGNDAGQDTLRGVDPRKTDVERVAAVVFDQNAQVGRPGVIQVKEHELAEQIGPRLSELGEVKFVVDDVDGVDAARGAGVDASRNVGVRGPVHVYRRPPGRQC